MLRRLMLGLLKGVAVGGAIGALLHFAARQPVLGNWVYYLLYGGVAALAGVIAGQPPWRDGAWVASILKAVVGFGIGVGVYALVDRFLKIPVGGFVGINPGVQLSRAPLLFAPAVATVYATLVELDDGGDQPAQEKTGVRVKPSVDDIDVGEDEEDPKAKAQQKGSARAKR